jgi:acetyl-CoA synthetase
VTGLRPGTVEIESALAAHPKVADAAVVGYQHDLKGQGIYAFVTLKVDEQTSEELRRQLVQSVRAAIGPIAAPDIIHWTERLRKTRSGKIMRRVLRKIAAAEFEELGDTSTIADPAVIDELVAQRRESPPRPPKA